MKMEQFMSRVLEAAKAAGIDPAEVYYSDNENFRVGARDGEIDSYTVASTARLSLRGVYESRMGNASTEAFDEDAIAQLVEGVKDSASLVETAEQDEIFEGEKEYPVLEAVPSDVATTPAEVKIKLCLDLEAALRNADPRIAKVANNMVASGRSTSRLQNSYGLNLSDSGERFMAYASAVAKDGDSTASGGWMASGHMFAEMDAEKIAHLAAEDTLSQLHGSPIPTGEYRVILRNDAMLSLLQTFSGIFSAENAQQNLSLLGGKEGEMIASQAVTLLDDPLLYGGAATSSFDGEGSACYTKKVIDAGRLTTLLHSRKTAKKQGVKSTGNAGRFGGTISVAPTNFYFAPGEKDLAALMADVGEGVVITELSGMHAGANPTSGDFSLLSKGYTFEGGKRVRPVERITVAGNFYQLLKNIRTVGSDLEFFSGSIGSPSVDVGVMKISG